MTIPNLPSKTSPPLSINISSMNELIPNQELEVYKGQLESAEKYGTSLEVKTDNDYHSALTEAKSIKNQLEIIVKRKEAITKPQYSAYKSAMDFFKPFEINLKNTLDIIKAKMTAFSDEKERKVQLANARMDVRVEKGTISEAQANVTKFMNEVPKTVVTGSGSATTKKVPKYYVVDKTQIPIEFLEPDMMKIKASFKSGFPVPGVEVRMESELSLR